MKNKLLTILKSFSKAEIKRLMYYLRNPFFSHNKNLVKFSDNLLKLHPSYLSTQKEKIELFAKVYGKAKYNDSSFRSLYHLMLARVKEFIAVEKSLKDKKYIDLSYIKFLNERGMDVFFEENIKRIENTSIKSNYHYSEELLFLYEIEVLKFNYSKVNKYILHLKSVVNRNNIIYTSNRYLSLHYFLEIVSDFVICSILVLKYNLTASPPNKIEEILNFDKLKKFFNTEQTENTFLLYLALYKTFKNISVTKYYFEYKELVLSTIELFTNSEKLFHLSSMISYCLIKKNQESNSFYSFELWKLYGIMLQNDLHSNTKSVYIDIWLYRAILFLGLKLKLFEDVIKFIQVYSKRVSPEEIKNIYNLSYAYYYYEKNELNESLNYAKKIKLTNFILKYDIKNLLVKVYYELKVYDSLDYAISAYHGFLKNDRILNSKLKKQFEKFLKYTEKLYKPTEEKKKEIEFIYYEILNSDGIYSKEWLLKMYSIKFANYNPI